MALRMMLKTCNRPGGTCLACLFLGLILHIDKCILTDGVPVSEWRIGDGAKAVKPEFYTTTEEDKALYNRAASSSHAASHINDQKREPVVRRISWPSHDGKQPVRRRRESSSHTDSDHLHGDGVDHQKHKINSIPIIADPSQEKRTTKALSEKQHPEISNENTDDEENDNAIKPHDLPPDDIPTDIGYLATTQVPVASRSNKDNRVDRPAKQRQSDEPSREGEGYEVGNRDSLHTVEVSESVYKDDLLTVTVEGDEHEVIISWTYPYLSDDATIDNSAPYYTGFKVTYKAAEEDGDAGEEYESPKLSRRVRTFLLHSLHLDEEYIICVHVVVNTTSVQHACETWSHSSLKILVGILAGTIFLIPCIIALSWILHKDRKMRQKITYRQNRDAQAARESLIKPSVKENGPLMYGHQSHDNHLHKHVVTGLQSKPAVNGDPVRPQSSKSIFPSHLQSAQQGKSNLNNARINHADNSKDSAVSDNEKSELYPSSVLQNLSKDTEIVINTPPQSKIRDQANLPLCRPLMNPTKSTPPVQQNSTGNAKSRSSESCYM